jgi:hypothetical protein
VVVADPAADDEHRKGDVGIDGEQEFMQVHDVTFLLRRPALTSALWFSIDADQGGIGAVGLFQVGGELAQHLAARGTEEDPLLGPDPAVEANSSIRGR